MQRIFSSREVGKLVGADPSSVNRWIDSGRLKAYRTPGGHRRVLLENLVAFLNELAIPVPAELRARALSLLLCDSDEGHLRGLRRGLQRLDRELELRACGSALEALILLGAHRPDAMLLDVSPAGTDALEICRRIKSSSDTAAVVLVACATRPTAQLESRLREAGVRALLPKPVKPASLLELARPGSPP
jgi:excisionase family DNA binding protein